MNPDAEVLSAAIADVADRRENCVILVRFKRGHMTALKKRTARARQGGRRRKMKRAE